MADATDDDRDEPLRLVSVTGGGRFDAIWTPVFLDALDQLGEHTQIDDGHDHSDAELTALVGQHDVAVVGWDTHMLPTGLADDPGHLRFICCYSGTVRHTVPEELVAAGLWVSNWGDLPAQGVAEAALTHLLVALKRVPTIVDRQRTGEWGYDTRLVGSLGHLTVGVYGLGVIGRRFVDLLAPFGGEILAFDPYVDDLPAEVERVDDLDALFDRADAVVLHAGLTDETEGSVTADRLARLPHGGIVVNTARGALVDQDALFAEVEAGRLRVGVDVLEPDELAADHPVRRAPDFLVSFHQMEARQWPLRPGLTDFQERCVENIARFARGETPHWLFDVDRYRRST